MYSDSYKDFDVVLEKVSKTFGDVNAVDNISIKVNKETFLTLLGPSGCGKTTTLRIIGGLEWPTSGDVYIKGRNMTNVPPYKRETNLVFQDFALFPHMSILSNIGFGLRMRGMGKGEIHKRVKKILDMVDLPDILHRKPSELSGGQKQRVALCRSLILEPAVLLLDEPLGALDAKIRKHMQKELKDLQVRLKRTFISVTHDQEEAMTMSDQIAIMNHGFIEQVGSPATVYEKPHSRFVATFLGECNLIDVVVTQSNPGSITVKNTQLGTFCFHPDNNWRDENGNDRKTLMIRPENIAITTKNGDGCGNQIDGTVKEVVFKGSSTEYLVNSGATEIKVQVQGKNQIEIGAQIMLTWRPEDCYLIN